MARSPLNRVIEAAQVIKQITDDLEIDTYCKTSGSTGLHIYIPLGAQYDYDQIEAVSRA